MGSQVTTCNDIGLQNNSTIVAVGMGIPAMIPPVKKSEEKKEELFKMASFGEEFEDKVFAGWDELEKGRKNLNFEKGLQILENLWNELPEPKYIYDESFLIVDWILEAGIQSKNIELMKKWVGHIMKADLERLDIGERENRAGEVAFECGDLDQAYEYFDIANKKSLGTNFHEKKYREFYIKRKLGN